MDHFAYRNRQLFCEEVSVAELAAAYGTPLYIYSRATLEHHYRQIAEAFSGVDTLICYSIKTNPNIHVCSVLREQGSGFDVTSGGELYRALQAGGEGAKIVFAGVGKTDEELRYGLDSDVLLFNVESEAELHALAEVARSMDKTARVALRVNPALPPKTHRKTDTSVRGTKFGLDIDSVLEVAAKVVGHPHVRIAGLHMHLGSPILSAQPYREGIEKGAQLIEHLRRQGHEIGYINMGGGFGIHYRKQEAPPAHVFAEAIVPVVRELGCRLVLEPGRFIAGNAGIFVTRVIYTKESGGRRFIIQDGGMNDLIRPTLYEAFHRIWPVRPPDDVPEYPEDFEAEIPGTVEQDVVGPVCETGDYLALDRRLPLVQRGELLATFSAGAYGMAMASNYNSRPRPAEVLVEGGKHRLIRRRETYEDLVRPELEV